MARARRRGRGLWVLAIFAVLWTAGVVAIDFAYLRSVVQQGRTAGFARTEGAITSSDVTTRLTSGDNGVQKMHGVALRYTYDVGGRTYHGSRYRVSESEQSGSWAADLARQLPVGSRVPVYYAPEDPSEAVLRPGLSTAESFFALFIFPFNVAALGLWWAVRSQRRVDRRGDETGGLRVVETGGVTRVLPDGLGAAGTALAWAAFADFVAAIVLAVAYGFEPPARAVAVAVLVVLAVAAVAGRRASVRRRAGARELVIDAAAQTLRLPRTGAVEPPPPIPWASIAEVVLQRARVETQDLSTWAYSVSLSRADGTSTGVGMATWYDPEPAERFRAWLATRLGRPSGQGILEAS